jgi:hypothetical protein
MIGPSAPEARATVGVLTVARASGADGNRAYTAGSMTAVIEPLQSLELSGSGPKA